MWDNGGEWKAFTRKGLGFVGDDWSWCGVPSTMASDFERLSWRKCWSIQELISSRQWVSLEVEREAEDGWRSVFVFIQLSIIGIAMKRCSIVTDDLAKGVPSGWGQGPILVEPHTQVTVWVFGFSQLCFGGRTGTSPEWCREAWWCDDRRRMVGVHLQPSVGRLGFWSGQVRWNVRAGTQTKTFLTGDLISGGHEVVQQQLFSESLTGIRD